MIALAAFMAGLLAGTMVERWALKWLAEFAVRHADEIDARRVTRCGVLGCRRATPRSDATLVCPQCAGAYFGQGEAEMRH